MEIKDKEYINDQVRLSVDSAIQALTILVHGMIKDQQKHQESEIESRAKFKEEMIQTVKTTVNGKIDRLQKTVEELAPLIQQDKEKKIVEKSDKERSALAIKFFVVASTVGGGLYAIKQFFIWFLK